MQPFAELIMLTHIFDCIWASNTCPVSRRVILDVVWDTIRVKPDNNYFPVSFGPHAIKPLSKKIVRYAWTNTSPIHSNKQKRINHSHMHSNHLPMNGIGEIRRSFELNALSVHQLCQIFRHTNEKPVLLASQRQSSHLITPSYNESLPFITTQHTNWWRCTDAPLPEHLCASITPAATSPSSFSCSPSLAHFLHQHRTFLPPKNP